jgi:resolvase-like protein
MPRHSGTWISYLRVSTDRQGKSGLGLEAQRDAVARYLKGGKWILTDEFVEVESGGRRDRPQLKAALDACKRLRARLVVATMSRLTRDPKVLRELQDAGVDMVFCDLPEIPAGPMGRLFSGHPRPRERVRGGADRRAHQARIEGREGTWREAWRAEGRGGRQARRRR